MKGTLTTAHVLSTISFHLVENPEIVAQLQQELKVVMKDSSQSPRWQQLEKLPYLVRRSNAPNPIIDY